MGTTRTHYFRDPLFLFQLPELSSEQRLLTNVNAARFRLLPDFVGTRLRLNDWGESHSPDGSDDLWFWVNSRWYRFLCFEFTQSGKRIIVQKRCRCFPMTSELACRKWLGFLTFFSGYLTREFNLWCIGAIRVLLLMDPPKIRMKEADVGLDEIKTRA